MRSAIAAVLVVLGSSFALIAAVGLLRMPDLPMRMHAATKAGTLGTGLLLAALSVRADESSVTIRAAAAILFLFLTAPVGAHMIARAAYLAGTMELWPGTLDEWRAARGSEPDQEPRRAPDGPAGDPDRPSDTTRSG